MRSHQPLTFKIASEDREFEQINRLNYETFVEEIPHNEANPGRSLVDKFDGENTYMVCLHEDRVVGMIAMRGKRPFSLDQKLDNLDSYLPRDRSICELRLLTVDNRFRNSRVFGGLVKHIARYGMGQGYDLAVISGIVNHVKLYEHLGFVPFGPLVGKPGAMFQPMYLTLEAWRDSSKSLFKPESVSPGENEHVTLLPGPVAIGPEVRRAFAQAPISHRSDSFRNALSETRETLCRLVGAKRVEIMVGSGTLANDAVAAQLSLEKKPGLVLNNGEFGSRLVDHATRFGLSFDTLGIDWGEAFDPDQIEGALDPIPDVKWLWAVHCETSTGILNDLGMLKKIAAGRGIHLCLDCISSIGTVPIDLGDVRLASGAAGKGLGAFSGLSMVFYNHEIKPAPEKLPRYLDLGLYAMNSGIPFTHSSNLIYALRQALKRFESEDVFARALELSQWLRARLRELGFRIVAPDQHASPAAITLALPDGLSSMEVGRELEELGYFLYYKGGYLIERNWLQICLMGDCSQERLIPLLDALSEISL